MNIQLGDFIQLLYWPKTEWSRVLQIDDHQVKYIYYSNNGSLRVMRYAPITAIRTMMSPHRSFFSPDSIVHDNDGVRFSSEYKVTWEPFSQELFRQTYSTAII